MTAHGHPPKKPASARQHPYVATENPVTSPANIAADLAGLAHPIDGFELLDGNPRVGDVDAVAASLRRFGQRKPIVARRSDMQVIAGNHTLKAARLLGWPEIAAVLVDDDDPTAKAFALADNRTAELGGYDDDNLAAMIRDVAEHDAELLADTGWGSEAVDRLLEEIEAAQSAGNQDDELAIIVDDEQLEAVPDAPADPVTKRGDVWLLGPHRILCGDCRDPDDVARLLAGAEVNLAFTSPPYADRRTYDESSGFRPIPPDEYVAWFEPVAANVAAHLAADGSWFVNIKEGSSDGARERYVLDLFVDHIDRGWRYIDQFVWPRPAFPLDPINAGRLKNGWEPVMHFTRAPDHKFRPAAVMVESDNAFTYDPERKLQGNTTTGFLGVGRDGKVPGLAYPSNVLPSFGVANTGTIHSAAFPVGLPEWFIKAYTDEHDNVFDPFMGSGSTLLAAHRQSRTAYGTELSPSYVDVICARFQKATGIVPILEATGEPHDFTRGPT